MTANERECDRNEGQGDQAREKPQMDRINADKRRNKKFSEGILSENTDITSS
jgi:hypothetical protein